jgi:hypothetical protein
MGRMRPVVIEPMAFGGAHHAMQSAEVRTARGTASIVMDDHGPDASARRGGGRCSRADRVPQRDVHDPQRHAAVPTPRMVPPAAQTSDCSW